MNLTLADFDGKLMDGFVFCKKVYEFFDQVQRSPDGKSRLLRQPSLTEKRLLEELLPITRYLQTKYGVGLHMKVRWFAGSQQYDALLQCSGSRVEQGIVPQKQYLEVTSTMHPNDYLGRELLDTQGFTFGTGDTERDPKTRKIVSRPYNIGGKSGEHMLEWIRTGIAKKNSIIYPKNTVLIVDCHPETLMLEPEWQSFTRILSDAKIPHRFIELFLIERVGNYTATIYPPRLPNSE
jgi:hypothetical protein